jgi:hypothetical protein
MSRTLRPLAAFAMVALIGVISAGCGSNAASETGAAGNTGTVSNTGVASNTGAASSTGTVSNKRATDQDKTASPSSAGSPPSPAGRLPDTRSKDAAPISRPGPGPLSTQSTHEGRRHE